VRIRFENIRYIYIILNGSNREGQGSLKAATQLGTNQILKYLYVKKPKMKEQRHSSDSCMSPVLNNTKEGGWLHMHCSKRWDHVLAGQSAPAEVLAKNAGT